MLNYLKKHVEECIRKQQRAKHIIHIISNIKKTCDKLTSTSVNIDGEADKLSKIKELFNLDSSENAYMNIRGFLEKEEKRLKKR